jgi:DNA invertase Pin-like site-specific DNA recombinase
MPRTQLDAAIDAAAEGDVLVSVSLESLARSLQDLFAIVRRLEARKASLRVLHVTHFMPLDTASVEGRAILGALAVMQLMTPGETAQTGMEQTGAEQTGTAQSESPQVDPADQGARPRGRPATAVSQSGEVARLHASGLRATDIADRLGIGRASVYRILSQGGASPAAPTEAGSGIGRAAQLARRLRHPGNAG